MTGNRARQGIFKTAVREVISGTGKTSTRTWVSEFIGSTAFFCWRDTIASAPAFTLLRPDKTFIGRISRGFDFLSYHFAVGEAKASTKQDEKEVTVTLSLKTIERFVDQWFLRYARGAGIAQLWDCARRFLIWATSVAILGEGEAAYILPFPNDPDATHFGLASGHVLP